MAGAAVTDDPFPLAEALAVAAAASSIPGIGSLHSGAFGEIALLYPGQRVSGLRFADGRLEVHVVLDLVTLGTSASIYALADAVRAAVNPHTVLPVDVIVADATDYSPR